MTSTISPQKPDSSSPAPGPDQGEFDSRQSLVRLLLFLLAVVAAAVVTGTTNWLEVIFALVVMVMVHEFGHFVTAKWSKMKVTEYFLGFGPRLWSIKRGETEYGVKAIPAGGYVKIIGMSNLEEVPPEDEPRTYRQKPFHNRLMVAVAGSFMHFVMAFILLWVVFSFYGVPTSQGLQVSALDTLQHGADPAKVAGVLPGDVIVSADGHAITMSSDGKSNLDPIISNSTGKPVNLVVRRDGQLKEISVVPVLTPAKLLNRTGKPEGAIGVELESPLVTSNPFVALGESAKNLVSITGTSIAAVGHRFSPSGLAGYFHDVTNKKAAEAASSSGSRPVSIVGAARLGAQAAQAGFVPLAEILISINIFVGLLNLLPMLPLDGGHVLIAVYERIKTRRGQPSYHADVTKLNPVAYLFIAFLALIVFSALYLDIVHPVANPFK